MTVAPAISTLATIASPPAVEVAAVLLICQGIGPVLSIFVRELASEASGEVAEVLGEVAIGVGIRGVAAKVLEEGLEIVGQVTVCEL